MAFVSARATAGVGFAGAKIKGGESEADNDSRRTPMVPTGSFPTAPAVKASLIGGAFAGGVCEVAITCSDDDAARGVLGNDAGSSLAARGVELFATN